MLDNSKKSKLSEKFKNIIAFTDGILPNGELLTITLGGLNSKERSVLFDVYDSENGVNFNKTVFTSNRNKYFILWMGSEPVGLFSLEMRYENSDNTEPPIEALFLVDVFGVFIIKQYRGTGLGSWLACEAANYVRNRLLYKATRDAVSTALHVVYHADYESEEGEEFCENFFHEIQLEDLLEKMVTATGKSFSSCIDSGY